MAMNFGVLPARAIAFQILFLLVAIALEALVLYRRLPYTYKSSVRYAATLNLLSTFVGWVVFFNVQQLLPEDLRIQLISFFFFERFFPNDWSASISPMVITTAFGIFLGVIFVEYQGLMVLEAMLETRKPQSEMESILRPRDRFKFRRLEEGGILFKQNDRAYTLLVANSLSFSAILMILLLRWLDQTYFG
jgi:hypothetical protein